ncbi:hypothetical protein [Saccharothrix lopnurensis]|uniref:Uncharacterized protein n=1 Tax=Saccharothrix lopnurensis TaxID=1670621 RepID=A0ABW1P0S0_9PSEU
MRKLVCALAVAVAAAGMAAGPAAAAPAPAAEAPRAAVTCGTGVPVATTGGYRVLLHCPGVGYVSGAGTTAADADTRARALANTSAATGRACTTGAVNTTTGGYLAVVECGGLPWVFGKGTTLTDAAYLAHLQASDAMSSGKVCSTGTTNTTPGGYLAAIECTGLDWLIGRGTTLTEAALFARALAVDALASGRPCSSRSSLATTGGFQSDLECRTFTGSLRVLAVGTTLTDAASESRVLAINSLATGRVCSTVGNVAVPAGYRVTLNCGSGPWASGEGPTLSEAARVARGNAY